MAGKLVVRGAASKKSKSKKAVDPAAPTCCEADRTPSFNETTLKALDDAKSDKNLTRYADEDELFEKLGIKVGKAKADA